MIGVWPLFGLPQTIEQQQLVDGIDERVHGLAEHGRAARKRCRSKLDQCNRKVPGERGVYHSAGFNPGRNRWSIGQQRGYAVFSAPESGSTDFAFDISS